MAQLTTQDIKVINACCDSAANATQSIARIFKSDPGSQEEIYAVNSLKNSLYELIRNIVEYNG